MKKSWIAAWLVAAIVPCVTFVVGLRLGARAHYIPMPIGAPVELQELRSGGANTERRIPELNRIANDRSRSVEDRFKAIYTLFVNYVRPGFDARDMGRVLLDTRWLDECTFRVNPIMTGYVPVDVIDSAFCGSVCHISLFGAGKTNAGWEICLGLSGHDSDTAEAGVLDFLGGRMKLAGNIRLVDYSISGLGFESIEVGKRGLSAELLRRLNAELIRNAGASSNQIDNMPDKSRP